MISMETEFPNEKDPDSDGDGCPDTEEAGHTDADGDGFLGSSPVTVDESGLVIGQGGYSGNADAVLMVDTSCEAEEEDCDNDGVADIDDLDNDNDGILDTEECPSATDITAASFGASTINVMTSLGNVVTIDGGEFITQMNPGTFAFPEGIVFGLGTGLVNKIEFSFPFEVTSVTISTKDYDFREERILEYMDNFSIVPSRITGEGALSNGRIDPTLDNALIILYWKQSSSRHNLYIMGFA